MIWQSDDDLFRLARSTLYTSVVGDIMDQLGLHDQFLPPAIKPLRADMLVVGRAMPVLEADAPSTNYDSNTNPVRGRPFGLMFEALDDLKPNEVYVCTGASAQFALWGELMSTRAHKLAAAGAVLDGYSRDTRAICKHALPVFSHGGYGQDQGVRGKVIDFRVPIRMQHVWIHPGDIIFGDIDGVCVVPRSVEEDVFRLALEKASGESRVREAIEAGMSSVDAFESFGIM